jgi:TorA maturation chaperone TorD
MFRLFLETGRMAAAPYQSVREKAASEQGHCI